MKKQEVRFQSTTGHELVGYTIKHPQEKAKLHIVHGMGEHIGRYDFLAARFYGLGYSIYGYDHFGHGKSEGDRAYFTDVDDFVSDMRTWVELQGLQESKTPVFLVAHSLGSLISLRYLMSHDESYMAVVMSGTALEVAKKLPKPLLMMADTASKYFPKGRWIKFERKDICRNPKTQEDYFKDPLVNTTGNPNRSGVVLMKAMEDTQKSLHKIHQPLLIMHGGDDKLCHVRGSELLFEKASSIKKKLRIYDGYYHEVLNEEIRPQLLDEIQAFFEEHL